MTDKLVSISFEDFKDANETFLDGAPLYTIRFNSATYQQNMLARISCEEQCLYGTTNKIKTLALDSPMYVIEMNIDTNMIEGIGYIYNNPLTNFPEIYSQGRLNGCIEFVYGGEHHITREDICSEFPELVVALENKLFKGKGNQKRGIGFTRLPAKTYTETSFTEATLTAAIKQVFANKYF